MSPTRITTIALLAALTLTGCDSTRKMLTQTKASPDEFSVYTRAPLSLPPQYDLRPPEPGMARPQADNPRADARQILLGRDTTVAVPVGSSTGMQSILRQTGALEADGSIRSLVNQESSILAREDKTLSDRLIFWNTPNEPGTSVDPAAEQQRLRENMALGKPVTEGYKPIIEKKRKALLDGIFN